MVWPFSTRGDSAARRSSSTLPRRGRKAANFDMPAEDTAWPEAPAPQPDLLAGREPFMRRAGRIMLRTLFAGLIVLLVAGAVAGGVFVHRFIYRTDYFQVREVKITGAGDVLEQETRDWLTQKLLTAGDNLVRLNTGALIAGLTRLPRAKQVRVHKIYPDTLQVSLVERKPVMVAQLDHAYLMDNEGVLLAAVPAKEVARLGLPLVTGIHDPAARAGARISDARLGEVLETVAFINTSDPLLKEEIRQWDVKPRGEVIATLKSGTEVRFGTEPLLEVLPRLSAGLEQHRDLAQATYIDLRMDQQLVYKHERPSQR